MSASQAQSEVGLKERFFRSFQHDVAALQEQIDRLNTIPGNERNEAVDQCLAGIDRLSHEVKDASCYIPAYDQRTYSQTIKGLSEILQTVRNTFNPPKKFSFKTRKNAPAVAVSGSMGLDKSEESRGLINTSDTANADSSFPSTALGKVSREEEDTPKGASRNVEEIGDGIRDGPGVRRPSFSNASKINIANHSKLHLALPTSASSATSSGTLSNLQSCVVDLSIATTGSPFAALYLKNIKDSLIVCGQIAGAIHITNVENSVLVITCRQSRMHGSKNVDVYLHSLSRPIIEDCQNVRFAPLPQTFAGPELDHAANQWDQIDDFKWLKVEPSPNFGVLAEAQRVGDEVWRDKVQGGGDGDLEEILQAVRKQ
ncbi:tubulin-specific chaperone-like protein c [Ophiobolus disseminans]|uniref:Tubulin-specific chaperone-like protein c n=1 Tax=Ophiobolus disseminans TaxID=1469910 RepID=A0A6A7A3V6_9PLEO|nr:tubulin-specific chaperone-like protein c [Ophiobolus disseminans]